MTDIGIKEKTGRTVSIIGSMGIGEFVYYLAYGLYFFSCILDRTTFDEFLFIPVPLLSRIISLIILCLLLFKFVLQKASIKGWLLATGLVLVGFISWRNSQEGWLFWLALFIVCSEGVQLNILASISLALSIMILVIAPLFSVSGMIEELTLIRAGVARHSLGFTHPNNFGMYVILACTSISVLAFGKNPLFQSIILFFAAYLIMVVSDSRSTAVLAIFQALLLLVFFKVKNKRLRRIISIGFVVVVALIVFVSFYFMIGFNPSRSIDSVLNTLLSGRLRLAHGYYQMKGLSLFGTTYIDCPVIYWENGKSYHFVVDNAYCHLILRYGIIPTALFIIGLFSLLIKLFRQNRWDSLLFGIVLMSVYGLTETLGVRIECNYFLFAIGADLLFSSSEINTREASRKNYIGVPHE